MLYVNMKKWVSYITAVETVQSSRGSQGCLSEEKGKKQCGGKKQQIYKGEKREKKSTYINFTQYHIDNTSNDNDKVKNIPWVSKVTLEKRKQWIVVCHQLIINTINLKKH